MSKNGYSKGEFEDCRSVLKDWETILNKPNINLSQVRFWNFSDLCGTSRSGERFQCLTIQDRDGHNLIDLEGSREILNLVEQLRLFSLDLIAESLGLTALLPDGQRVAWYCSLGERFSIILIFDGRSHHKDELIIKNIKFIN